MDVYLIGGISIGAIVILASILGFIAKQYIRVSPNRVAVVFGRNHSHKVKFREKQEDGTFKEGIRIEKKGYRIVKGGGFMKIPILEEVQELDLSVRQTPIQVKGVPNIDGVMTSVDGTANVKFASEDELLVLAIERFLGKDSRFIDDFINKNLEGHLRAVVGKMTMEELIGNKEKLNQNILGIANEDFAIMGIKIDFLNIADIKDDVQYIENLGKKRAAEIERNALIGEADAQRDSTIKTTLAQRLGVEAANKNKIVIAESDRDRDVRRAEMKAQVDKENAIAAQAGPMSNAKALEGVVKAQAATAAAQETANIEVEKAKALKEEQRYNAEIIVPATAQKTAKIINANAQKETVIISAEGSKSAAIKTAEGEAEAVKVNAFALAEGEAAKIRQQGQAEADAIEAKLLAEAKGIAEKAKAYELLDQTGKFLEVLNALQTLGPNMVKEFAGVMAASTAHLANVDEIKIVDFGGDSAGGSAVGKLGNVPNEVMTKLLAGADATGFDVSKLLKWAGFAEEEVKDTTDAPITITKKPEAPKESK